MTKEEYERKRREIIEAYSEEIAEHESAGCYGDAQNARKWMHHRLSDLKDECEGVRP